MASSRSISSPTQGEEGVLDGGAGGKGSTLAGVLVLNAVHLFLKYLMYYGENITITLLA